MAPSKQPTDVLELGRLIVSQLGTAGFRNTLAGWMSHYIAELIQSVETADEKDRPEKLSRCANAILELWKHGDVLPDGMRPFEGIEPILRTLASLDPNDHTPRYFRAARAEAGKADQEEDAKKWLDLADGLDYSARILIRYCLACAAQNALDKSKEWVALAEAAGAEDKVYLPVINLVSDETELADETTHDDAERKEIENRLKRLDEFAQMAGALSRDLRARLQRLDEEAGQQ